MDRAHFDTGAIRCGKTPHPGEIVRRQEVLRQVHAGVVEYMAEQRISGEKDGAQENSWQVPAPKIPECGLPPSFQRATTIEQAGGPRCPDGGEQRQRKKHSP
jgi:hypothetical protein